MAKRSKAFALLLLLFIFSSPTQFASASPHSEDSARPSIQHREDDDESESENEDDDESEDEDSSDDDGKQFVPPPLVVKHKSLDGSSKSSKPDRTNQTKSGKQATVLPGIVPSSEDVLLRAAGLGIVTLEQAFATNDYVTSAVTPDDSKGPAGKDGDQTDGDRSAPDELDPNLNEPVVNQLGATSYEDPATEFIHKAYFGLAVLGAGAIGMAAHTISKTRRAGKANENDYDYEGQN